MHKKDLYASVGTIIVGVILLLCLLWFKLSIFLPVEEQGIEVGYGIDLEGEVGGSSGGQRGDFAGDTDGDFYEKKIDVPSFSEKPVVNASQTSSSDVYDNQLDYQDEFFTQTAPSGAVANNNANNAVTEEMRRAQEEASRIRQEERRQKSDKAKSLGASAFGNSGGNGSGGLGLGSGKGSGSGAGTGTGVGDGVGSGTKGNPFGKGTSNGHNWSLTGRSLKGNISKPVYRENVEGKITVKIRVDDMGNVTNATIGSPTTIADESLRNETLNSARKTKFSAGKGVVYGTIVYHFKLN